MLTTTRMDRLIIDVSMGNALDLKTKEEQEFVNSLRGELQEVRDAGMILAIPAEIEVSTE